jgi:predicted phage terminase large subunit-like protein
VRGGLTGRAVDLLIIDDPYRDGEQADSVAWRETVQGWWSEVALPRLGPGVAVVIIQTRWRQDDLSGWLQKEHPAEWRIINIPAEADHDPAKGEVDPLGREPGDFMISARGRSVEEWEKKKREVGSRTWTALFQGRPTPGEGLAFHRDWWNEYDVPQWVERDDGSRLGLGFDEIVQSWDMAFKDLSDSDYVVGQVWGRRGIQAWLLDQVRGRYSFTDTCMKLRELSARWPQATAKYVEDKANGTAVMNALRLTVPGMIPVEPDGSKLARALAVSPFVEGKNVWLPAPELHPWVGELIEEAADFPLGSHDDQVDALSQALNRLLLSPILAGVLFEEEDDDDREHSGISVY